MNLMNCGRLKPKIEIFDPKKVFDFVNNMFQEQCRMQGIQMTFKTLNHAFLDLPVRDLRILMVQNQSILDNF